MAFRGFLVFFLQIYHIAFLELLVATARQVVVGAQFAFLYAEFVGYVVRSVAVVGGDVMQPPFAAYLMRELEFVDYFHVDGMLERLVAFQMLAAGYYTEQNTAETIKDNKWFEQQLREGKLLLEYYSTTERKFVSTSIDSDSSIQEVEDEREIARIEQEYKNKLSDLEAKDNKFDLELRKLDTEHSALQTEYDAVKNVIDKNVEKTFTIFS